MKKKGVIHFLIMSLIVFSCVENQHDKEYQFELLMPESTGLDFENTITQDLEFNVFAYMYIYNGGGVAVGDFNNDGLEDLFFTNNMGPNKMFLNEGDLKFRDISAEAGIEGIEGWSSGVSVVDINNDGLLDIYVNQLGDYKVISGHNQFFICKGLKNGVPYYEDQSDQLGLDLIGFSTQSAFFDYDLDGDLDMYQLNHSIHANGTFGQKKRFEGTYHEKSGDKLFRNDDLKFVEVTKEAGIKSTVIGYGLGIAIGDINNDGWPDIYIGNDFHEDDYLYLNNQNGTFQDVLNDQIMHTSRFSMGVDIADINNDAREDILSLDMLPEDPFILKSSLGDDDFDIFDFKLRFGYNHQYSRNNLQLNNGNGSFTELGIYADIYATDWSWSPLVIDFDLDGYKDIFISNGIPRRMNDIDYANFRKSDENVRFRTNTTTLTDEEDLELINKMPQIKLTNKFFLNNKELGFADIGENIKNDQISYSYGASYADLDKDGDLEVITNNTFDGPFLYKNLQIEKGDSIKNDFLSIHVDGHKKNSFAIGTRVILFKGDERIIEDNFSVKGYQSTASVNLTIGVGNRNEIDSVLIIWPDLTYQKLNPKFGVMDTISWQEDLPFFDFSVLNKPPYSPLNFSDITDESNSLFCHKENQFVGFNREAMIPFMVSSEGPALAVGDVNGDRLQDYFIGHSKSQFPSFFIQNADGTFEKSLPDDLEEDNFYEDVDASFSDVDKDGDLDLIVASGGNEFWGTSEYLNSRLYLNNGEGDFQRANAFGDAFFTASCVAVGDYNNDGYDDVFFGARAVPDNYGVMPESQLYQNLGDGKFINVSSDFSEISDAGLIKDAQWADIDSDGDLDLILAIEWGEIAAFVNNNGKFEKKPLTDYNSLWNFMLTEDFDADGDLDIIVGNVGENTKLKPSIDEPVRMYVNDFDDNGTLDQILTYYLKGQEIPFHTYQEIVDQLPPLKKQYLYSKDFAKASLVDLFGDKLKDSEVLSISDLSSVYLENKGGLNFKRHRLPTSLQLSSLMSGLTILKNEGKSYVGLFGNFYDNNIGMGRYDGNYGNVLTIGKDGLTDYPMGGLTVKGQVRNVLSIDDGERKILLLAKNNACLQIIELEN